ncbi:hypothetical protein HNY73_015228 [Argiope bruennichi]|uniref:Uncharacterized protein n=1 Tax=Argiope bruennichi TaxID=94029 RepID=A0A8T0ETC8_ARGBR|nr:hypothetical protein HNY73_015228 [Argiope bruennichi]
MDILLLQQDCMHNFDCDEAMQPNHEKDEMEKIRFRIINPSASIENCKASKERRAEEFVLDLQQLILGRSWYHKC